MTRALLDVYARWGEVERARAMVERLARLEPGDPSHLITLGQELLQRGDEPGSRAAFSRALERATDRAAAHAALGEIYLDQDQAPRALEHYTQAARLEPEQIGYARGFAEALERVRRFADAEMQWRKSCSLQVRTADPPEARRRIVMLWSNSGELRAKLRELERAFRLAPTDATHAQHAARPSVAAAADLEAGRFLAEGYQCGLGRRRALADATCRGRRNRCWCACSSSRPAT